MTEVVIFLMEKVMRIVNTRDSCGESEKKKIKKVGKSEKSFEKVLTKEGEMM